VEVRDKQGKKLAAG